ncbi:Uncharacterized protein GBIM_02475 [Gryllus bimaculatus]|nr:Uncharacterized protein GBIM_02475 [Gryllus bimaculatus]
MSEVKYERLYNLEKYDACVEEIEDILFNIRRRSENCNLFLGSRLDACAVDFECHVLVLMLEGNANVVRSMNVLETSIQQEWIESDLVNFFHKIKTLSSSACSIPFEVYLNSLFNVLWLLWAKRTCEDEDKDMLFEMLEDCFKKVLMSINVQTKPTSHESRGEIVLSMLNSVIGSVTDCEIPQCFQIIDLCLLCLHLFLQFKLASSKLLKSIIFILKDKWPLIKTKFAESLKGNSISTSNRKIIKLFKFGFLKVNETTDYSIPKVCENLSVMGCSLLYGLGYLQDCTDFHTNFLSDNCCNFMSTYIQADACLQLQAMDVSQLHIHKLSKIPLNAAAEKHFHLLKGKHAQLSGLAVDAHLEFTHVLQSKQFIYEGLINILNNLKIGVRTFYEESAEHGSDAVIDKLVRVLHCFQTFIANTPSFERNCKFSAENKILSVLRQGESHQPEDILCMIGKELLWLELHYLSSNSRSKTPDIAAKCYMNILCTYYKKDASLQMLSIHSDIIHEAVVAFLLCDKIHEAEIMCQILVQKCTIRDKPHENLDDTQEEFLMKSGVSAQMLMAYIKMFRKKYDEAQCLLTRRRGHRRVQGRRPPLGRRTPRPPFPSARLHPRAHAHAHPQVPARRQGHSSYSNRRHYLDIES